MKKLPEKQWLQQFQKRLVEAGYERESIATLLGSTNPPSPVDLPAAMYRTRSITPLNTLLRLFLLGQSVATAAAREALSANFIDNCLRFGLLESDTDRLHAEVVIVPVDDLLIASDAFRKLGGDDAAEFVLPASAHAADVLKRLTFRDQVDTCLDLGCGCGIHAMLAARHSKRVVASDISEAAVRYTEFNAILNNIDNITPVRSDLFDALESQQFDLIVCNPPFVIGPGRHFTYRDNPLELDEFCREIVRQGSAHLAPGGHLQMLCEWVEVEGEHWNERISAWFEGTGCDGWVLRTAATPPSQYVRQRSSDIVGTADDSPFADWLEYFSRNAVQAVDSGVIVLRKRDGEHWVQCQSITIREGFGDNAGEAIKESIAACDFLDLCKDDDSLLEACIKISPAARLTQHFERADDNWQGLSANLRLDSGLPAEAEVDMPILAFLNQLGGDTTLREAFADFADKVGAQPDALAAQLLPALRTLLARGLLVADDA